MQREQAVRLSVFAGVLLLVALGEMLSPRRPLADNKRRRWFTNLTMVVIDTAAVWLLFPVLPVALAGVAEARGWGIFNAVQTAPWLKFLISFLVLDFIIYLQHVLFHHTPILWRLHRMHHTDLDLDVTTGNRFHPLEIIISMLIKMAAVVILGAPAQAVLAFEVVLNACSMFNHGNIKLPATFDRLLRLVLVTPDMHRVHHSTLVRETNSNFGFNFPWWDRLCGTYRPQPEKGHLDMTIGLKEYRDPQRLTLLRLLVQPFTSP
ncbi:MAG: sterol desaturase family protein [Desulfuromonadaceae bacterium]|nr:sterol desaturase family protein [Desulfuromonadaceae bacterium]